MSGGWCYPSDVQQPCSPPSSHCSANCHIRANSTHGSSATYAKTIPPGAIEGGTGYTSGNASRTRFSDFGVAYARYCDGGEPTDKGGAAILDGHRPPHRPHGSST
jgi:hypothetical protein